jgi:hypothetical protein
MSTLSPLALFNTQSPDCSPLGVAKAVITVVPIDTPLRTSLAVPALVWDPKIGVRSEAQWDTFLSKEPI